MQRVSCKVLLLLLLCIVSTVGAFEPFRCDRYLPGLGKHRVNLQPAFEKGPLSFDLEQSTPPSTTITTVQMDLCKALPLRTDVDREEQCPDGTNVCMIVKNRRGRDERIEQVIPAAGSRDGLRYEKPLYQGNPECMYLFLFY